MGTTLDLKTVCECNRCMDTKTLHPQVTLVDLGKSHIVEETVKFEFYTILLIEDCPDGCACCGRKGYDYSYATMVFLSPGRIFQMNGDKTLPEKGRLLAFSSEFLPETPLRDCRPRLDFFHYDKQEALHLSKRETCTVNCCLENIAEELRHPVDTFSKDILTKQIELLMDYCTRFYERQFITRENKNKAVLRKVDRMLDEYLHSNSLQSGKLPTAEGFAENLGISTAYFNDLLRFETGKSLTELLTAKKLEKAKQLLSQEGASAAAVARRLGFGNTGYFSTMFRKVTGYAPEEYRYSRN